jgi:hypothetical protein
VKRMLFIAGSILASVAAVAAVALLIADRAFYRRFEHEAQHAKAVAGAQGSAPVTEQDLREVPEPIARWIRWSGAVGKARVSFVRVAHGGRFKSGATRPWMPIRGEYVITTKKPSFHWYGRMRMAPGVNVAAIDSYLDSHGRMVVKALSAFTLVDARSRETDQSAFGRCVAELSMAPTFFLDRNLVRCEQTGRDSARCSVADGPFSTEADLFVHSDGSLDRIVVMRHFDRGEGRSTLEWFTGKSREPRSYDGRMLASRFDGYWNLPDGDLHYVAFEVERVTFE